jgi:predicted membrane metal-binding protein
MIGLLWILLIIVLGVWLVGLLLDVVGGLIHILLIVALAILIYNVLTSRRAAR